MYLILYAQQVFPDVKKSWSRSKVVSISILFSIFFSLVFQSPKHQFFLIRLRRYSIEILLSLLDLKHILYLWYNSLCH